MDRREFAKAALSATAAALLPPVSTGVWLVESSRVKTPSGVRFSAVIRVDKRAVEFDGGGTLVVTATATKAILALVPDPDDGYVRVREDYDFTRAAGGVDLTVETADVRACRLAAADRTASLSCDGVIFKPDPT